MSLAEVLRECRAMIEPQARKRGIALSFPATFDAPCFVSADRTRVKQVLINLLSNAIKYNRAGRQRDRGLRRRRPGARCASACATPAPACAPEQLAQLFQPFNRLGQEAGTEEGTGIGLVVTKRLVELMGGAIGVESTVGDGQRVLGRTRASPRRRSWRRPTDEHPSAARAPRATDAAAAHAAVRGGQPGQPGAGRAADRAPAATCAC